MIRFGISGMNQGACVVIVTRSHVVGSVRGVEATALTHLAPIVVTIDSPGGEESPLNLDSPHRLVRRRLQRERRSRSRGRIIRRRHYERSPRTAMPVGRCGDCWPPGLIMEGRSREVAAGRSGMDHQTLRDWVCRYNDRGASGPVPLRNIGRTHVLAKPQTAGLNALLIKGSPPERDKVARWRHPDLREQAARPFTPTVGERTIWRWLRKMDLTRLATDPYGCRVTSPRSHRRPKPRNGTRWRMSGNTAEPTRSVPGSGIHAMPSPRHAGTPASS